MAYKFTRPNKLEIYSIASNQLDPIQTDLAPLILVLIHIVQTTIALFMPVADAPFDVVIFGSNANVPEIFPLKFVENVTDQATASEEDHHFDLTNF